MSLVRSAARAALAASGGDEGAALALLADRLREPAFVEALVNEAGAELERAAPALGRAVDEALAEGEADDAHTEQLLRERFDARENPGFATAAAREALRSVTGVLRRVLHEEAAGGHRPRG